MLKKPIWWLFFLSTFYGVAQADPGHLHYDAAIKDLQIVKNQSQGTKSATWDTTVAVEAGVEDLVISEGVWRTSNGTKTLESEVTVTVNPSGETPPESCSNVNYCQSPQQDCATPSGGNCSIMARCESGGLVQVQGTCQTISGHPMECQSYRCVCEVSVLLIIQACGQSGGGSGEGNLNDMMEVQVCRGGINPQGGCAEGPGQCVLCDHNPVNDGVVW